ncbi:hypothetical protein [Streptomyces sp. CA2R101]|uniref:hypothetical protein n=1 Tax=Streptomyces sp. CA2R101 TaxID=3120152 RepID=UPI00300B1303
MNPTDVVLDDTLINSFEQRLETLLGSQRRGTLEPGGKAEIKRIGDALAHRLPEMRQEGQR